MSSHHVPVFNPRKRQMKYKEGNSCPEFGRVRPVHLHQIVSFESRFDIDHKTGVSLQAARMGWGDSLPIPRVSNYLSLHLPTGKMLMQVERVVKSCVCCPDRAMTFVLVSAVPGVTPQYNLCRCAVTLRWEIAGTWAPIPEYGRCRKVGSESLRIISKALTSGVNVSGGRKQ